MGEEPVKRSTRGKRIDVTKLAELEAEQDEFWGKGGQGGDLFAEESDDESFDTSEEESENKEDSEDSDIDDPDNEKAEAVEVNENEDKDDAPKKKKNVYVDPARMKNKPAKPKPATSTPGEVPASEPGTAEETEAPRRGRKRKLSEGEGEQKEDDAANEGDEPAKKKQKKDDDARKLRRTTVQKSEEGKIIRQIEKDEADQRRKKRKQNKKVVKQFSQDELLAEARVTEKINQESLAEMMKLEEERKKIVVPKTKIVGPRIITLSRAKSHTVTFTDVDDLPAFLRAKAPPYPNQAMCVITGLPAKYFDPVTQMPYATTEAFKQLRAKYVK